MTSLPSSDWPDATAAILADPYRHILSRCRDLGTDGFRTRILGREAVCLTGREAARLLYDQDKIRREGAVPSLIRDVLFGTGGVQGLDGAPHHHRKRMHLKLLGPDADLDRFVARFDDAFRATAAQWHGTVEVFDEMKVVLTRSAYGWSGLPLPTDDAKVTADRLADLFMHAGPSPVGQIKARRARRHLERDTVQAIEDLRAGSFADVDAGRAFPVVALWKDQDGQLLPAHVAAVELLNIIRPTVAVSVFMAFAGLALARHRDAVARVRDHSDWPHAFVQEVRRTAPFFPATTGIARADLDWHGETIRAGTRVVLDLYGTNRDARHWQEPDRFDPARFLDWPGDPYTMVPQGAGEHARTHRCPGEWLTIRLMERFTTFMDGEIDWRLTDPDVQMDYSSFPALPKKGVLISV